MKLQGGGGGTRSQHEDLDEETSEREREGEGNAQEEAELVARVLEVREDDRVDHVLADALVAPVLGAVEHDAELVADKVEALLARKEAVRLVEAAQEELDAVRDERVVKVLLEDAEEDLLVGRARERLEDHDDRDHVLGLAPREPQGRAAVRQVVERVGLRRLVGPHRADRDAVLRVGRAAVAERRADDGRDVVAARDDEEPDQALVAVDDEVAAHLLGLLVVLDELGRRQVAQVTPSRLRAREEGGRVSFTSTSTTHGARERDADAP